MELTLWQIVEFLDDKDVEAHITPTCTRYAGIRQKRKPGYLIIEQIGYDCFVTGTGANYLKMKNVALAQAYEEILDIFDAYHRWETNVYRALETMDFQKIVDDSWEIFNNPLIIQDNNMKLLAMSTQVESDAINNEWKHLSTHGYVSVSAYKSFAQIYEKQARNPSTEPIYLENPKDSPNPSMLCGILRHNNIVLGRFFVVEYNKSCTKGDMLSLQHICLMISRRLGATAPNRRVNLMNNSIINMIRGEQNDPEEAENYYAYMGWEKDATLRVVTISVNDDDVSDSLLLLLSSYVRETFLQLPSFLLGQSIVLIVNEDIWDFDEVLEKLRDSYIFKLDTFFGVSLKFRGINRISEFAKQSVYALKRGSAQGAERFFFFWDYAVDYILTGESAQTKICACAPEVKRLFYFSESDHTCLYPTLRAYLKESANAIAAAKELGIHKNTLFYRIGKIEKTLSLDLNDPYTREYLRTSIRLMDNYRESITRDKYRF